MSLQLEPIEKDDWQTAADILIRGFRERPPGFWLDGLHRIRSVAPAGVAPRIGYRLRSKGDDVGVLLTLRTSRDDAGGGTRQLVNLAGWYVDERFRWFAPRMLSQLVGDEDAVFTDLTPAPAVRQLLSVMDFKPWNEGLLVASLPQTLPSWRKEAVVLRLDQLPPDALSDADRSLLEDHARFGCIVCVLHDGQTYHPLVFQRRVRWLMPIARIVYAPSRKAVIKHLANILYFLNKSGLLFIAVECDKAQCPPFCFFYDRSVKYYKGNLETDKVDYAYSEMVLFDF